MDGRWLTALFQDFPALVILIPVGGWIGFAIFVELLIKVANWTSTKFRSAQVKEFLFAMLMLIVGAYVLIVLVKGSLIILYTPIPGWR